MVPMPPGEEVPPMTAAAITYSSLSCSEPLVAALRRAICTAAAMATSTPMRAKVLTIVHGLDAAQLGRLGIAADGEHVPAEAEPGGDEGHDEGDDDGDQHGIGQTERDVDPPSGNGVPGPRSARVARRSGR